MFTVSVPNDPEAADFNAYADFVVQSAWISTIGTEYGVGKGQHIGSRMLATQPTWSQETDIEATLVAAIQVGSVPDPLMDENLLIIVLLPSGVSISDPTLGVTSCLDWGGYHRTTTANGQSFLYAVVANCPQQASQLKVTPLQFIQMAFSHELAEAATDPSAPSTLTFAFPAGTTEGWSLLGTEVADLCSPLPGASENGYTVARIWSNASAAKGVDPCLPTPADEVFFDTSGPADPVPQAAGGTTHIELQGWSTAAIVDWYVFAIPFDCHQGCFNLPTSIPGQPYTTNNNRTNSLPVTVPGGTRVGSYGPLLLVSQSSNSNQFAYWPVLVVAQ